MEKIPFEKCVVAKINKFIDSFGEHEYQKKAIRKEVYENIDKLLNAAVFRAQVHKAKNKAGEDEMMRLKTIEAKYLALKAEGIVQEEDDLTPLELSGIEELETQEIQSQKTKKIKTENETK